MEGRTATAANNSSLLTNIYKFGSRSLGLAEIRRTCVPDDDLVKLAYLHDYIKPKMTDGELPATYFESMSITRGWPR